MLVGCVKVRGFWMAPYLNKEAADRGKVLSDVMQYLADGVIVPHSGVLHSVYIIEFWISSHLGF